MKNHKKGFTLAEVLMAVAIPVFSSHLEKSREATDLANVRAAYAEVLVDAINADLSAMNGDGEYTRTVALKQKASNWTLDIGGMEIGGVTPDDDAHWKGSPGAGGSCTVAHNPSKD